MLALAGAIAWDMANDGFWARHVLFTGLVASFIATRLGEDEAALDRGEGGGREPRGIGAPAELAVRLHLLQSFAERLL